MKTSTLVSKIISRVAFLCLLTFAFIANNANAQISVSGGTGLAATYTSLTKAGGLFAALNANAQTGNSVVVSITTDVTDETGANALNQGAWTSLTITPSGARTMSGAVGGILLDINGADNVTINGLNTGGNSLILSNSNTGSTAAIRFTNDATSNTITNCTVRGSGNTGFYGVIVFAGGATSGNDNNTISNCTITAAGSNLPLSCVVSNGTSAAIANNNNTISGNNIADFFNATSASYGVYLTTTGNDAWTVSNNKFYQTASRTYTGATTHSAITLNSGNGHTISGNTIGYANSSSTGTYTMLGTVATRFIGINLSVGTTTATSVQGNTIASVNLTGSNANSTTTASIVGINIGLGNVNIGTTTGNTIGATSGQHSIVNNTTGSAGGIVGIYSSSTGTINISNTTIASLTDTSATASNALGIYAIYVGAVATSFTVANCTIGNSTAHNIIAGRLNFTTGACIVAGIAGVSTSTSINYNNNTIQNLSGYGATASGFTKGIYTTTSGSTTAATIYNNTLSTRQNIVTDFEVV